ERRAALRRERERELRAGHGVEAVDLHLARGFDPALGLERCAAAVHVDVGGRDAGKGAGQKEREETAHRGPPTARRPNAAAGTLTGLERDGCEPTALSERLRRPRKPPR